MSRATAGRAPTRASERRSRSRHSAARSTGRPSAASTARTATATSCAAARRLPCRLERSADGATVTWRVTPRCALRASLQSQLAAGAELVELCVEPHGRRQYAIDHDGSAILRQHDDAAVAEIAPARDAADLRVVYLRGSGVAAQLAYRLDDVVHPPHMALRQQPSVRVGRTRAAEPEA